MIERYGKEYRQYKLSASISGCGATYKYGFVLDSDGKIYKCWSDIGSECNPVSSIYKDVNAVLKDLEKAHEKWKRFNPYDHEKCKKCKMLPTCGGGCPEEYLVTDMPRCEFTKNQFEDMIKYRIASG